MIKTMKEIECLEKRQMKRFASEWLEKRHYLFFCFVFVLLFWFFSIFILFHGHSRFTGQQGKGEAICSTPLYHFHPLQRHLGISWVITAESSPLQIAKRDLTREPLFAERKLLTTKLRSHKEE